MSDIENPNPGDPHTYVLVHKTVSQHQKPEDAFWCIPTTEEEKASRHVTHRTLLQYVADIEATGAKVVAGINYHGNPIYALIEEGTESCFVSWHRLAEEVKPQAAHLFDLGTATLHAATAAQGNGMAALHAATIQSNADNADAADGEDPLKDVPFKTLAQASGSPAKALGPNGEGQGAPGSGVPSTASDLGGAYAVVENTAKTVYNGWRDERGWVPWVEGGNSLMQDEAREVARHTLTNVQTKADATTEEKQFAGMQQQQQQQQRTDAPMIVHPDELPD